MTRSFAGMTAFLLLSAIPPANASSYPERSVREVSVGEGVPSSREALFDISSPGVDSVAQGKFDAVPISREALFAQPLEERAYPERTPVESIPDRGRDASSGGSPVRGFFQTELAQTYAGPSHWSKAMGRLELATQGRLERGVRWKLSGRLDYNALFDLSDFYQSQVRDDQRVEFQIRESYLDFSSGVLDWRVGRQHVVWGEMVGLFFADVVSAKDLREFVLPDFQVMRIPQWAARTEYFHDDFHAEAVFIPFPSYDEIGKPKDFLRPGSGAAFYPYPPALAPLILNEVKPGISLEHSNFGVRVSTLKEGWDLSGFYYTSMNSAPTFYRTGVNTFTPRHDRIWQLGGTLGKGFGDSVFKAEMIYSKGRRYNLRTNLADPDGVVVQNTLDWVVGLDITPSSETRVNTQFFQRYFFDHEADIIPERAENGVSLLVNHKLPNNWAAEALLVHSLNRRDWMFRPRATWGFQQNWKMTLGVDVFHGPYDGLFGQYSNQDRSYVEIRHDF